MALEQNNEIHYREVPDKYVDPGVSYQMKTSDYVVRPSAILGPVVITLPPVAEAQGRFYSIIARAAGAPHTITIQDKDDSECWTADIVMNGKCDRVLMYSDGLAWHAFGAGKLGGWPGQAGTRAPGTVTQTTLAPTTLPETTVAPTTVLIG